MLELKQSIVVEGRGDAANISRVCRANFILTSGLHIARETYREIELAIEKTGIILFTDPDSAGRQIRRKILRRFSDRSERILHADIAAKEGRKKGDLGVENASEEAILAALRALRPALACEASAGAAGPSGSRAPVPSACPGSPEGAVCASAGRVASPGLEAAKSRDSEKRAPDLPYTMEEMRTLGLAGSERAMRRREELCAALRIGYCNAKQLCKKLSAYAISREEVKEQLSRAEKSAL